MHNCRLTRNGLVDLALDEVPSAEAEQLLSELNGCSSCREEYAALRNTWRISGQALQSALPTEEFWPGYHARLKSNLSQHIRQAVEQDSQEAPQQSLNLLGRRIWSAVVMQTASLRSLGWKLVTTSVRVPVPVALALVFLIGVLVLSLAGRASTSPGEAANATPSNQLPSVETRLVEVPVIQERVVTRVVYVEKKSSRSTVSNSPNREDGFARAGSDTSAETALSLVGFKPTDQVKLSIIKGKQNEK